LLHGTTDGTEPTRQRGGILDEYIETETAAPPIHTEQLVNDQNVAQLFHATTDQGYELLLTKKGIQNTSIFYKSRSAK